jgi:serine/threonine-protein kinase
MPPSSAHIARPLAPPPGPACPERIGPFEVISRIGSGGLALVYLGRRPGTDIPLVAIKIARSDLSDREHVARMFLDEARLLPLLVHPNIVRTLEVGVDGGTGFIAMELILGVSAAEIREECEKRDVALGAEVVATMGARVADALAYAHTLRDSEGRPLHVVHRDVNPANVMVTFDGQVKLIDFGVARAKGRLCESAPDIIKGQLPYISPEQVAQLPLDGRSDVFGLGTTLWELLTGRRLFRRESDLETVLAVRACKVPDPREHAPDVPEALVRIVLRALARDREARYPCARALKADLDAFLRLRGGHAPARLAKVVATFFPFEKRRQLASRSLR